MYKFLVAICFAFVVSVNSQRFVPGPCPTVKTMEGFDKSRFFGRWFEVEKTPSMFDLFLRCMSADYSDDNDGSLNVVIRGVSLAGLPVSLAGDALPVDSSKKGFYSVRYGFGVPFQGTLVTVVDTDYEKYAILYSCTNSVMSNLYHSEYIWLLGRNDSLPNYIRQNAYDTLDGRKITRTGLNLSDRNNCPPPNQATAGREELGVAPVAPLVPYVAGVETTTSSGAASVYAAPVEIVQAQQQVSQSGGVLPSAVVEEVIPALAPVPIVPVAPIAPIVPIAPVEPAVAVADQVANNVAEQIIV